MLLPWLAFLVSVLTVCNAAFVSRSLSVRPLSVCNDATICNVPDSGYTGAALKECTTVANFRKVKLTNVNNEQVLLGDVMGQRSMLVFLRHLGCPYCWSYANDLVAQKMALPPTFVSIGDVGKLKLFLQLNPAIPRDQVFVDCSSDRDAYKTAGFELLGPAAKGVKLTAPALGGVSGWFKYVTNMIRLSPTTQHHTDGTIGSGRIPEGVLQLGGTFIIDGDEIVYHWSDAVPGNHPDLNELATIASQVA